MRDAAQERRQSEARLVKEGGAPAAHTDPPRTVRLALPKTPETPAIVWPTLKAVPPIPVALVPRLPSPIRPGIRQ